MPSLPARSPSGPRLLQLHVSAGCRQCGGQLLLRGVALAVQPDGAVSPANCPGAMLAAASAADPVPQRARTYIVKAHDPAALARLAATGEDVTLATQLSLDRLDMLVRLAGTWPGPAVAVVYLPALASGADSSWQTAYLAKKVQQALAVAREPGAWTVMAMSGVTLDAPYPINTLRNAARAAARTRWVLVLDADFVPSRGLAADVARAAATASVGAPMRPIAFVIPAFEATRGERATATLPTDKDGVLTAVDAGALAPFRLATTPRSHAPTDYAQWRTAHYAYPVKR